MKLTFTGESLREIREQVMEAAASFLKYGIVAESGKIGVGALPVTEAAKEVEKELQKETPAKVEDKPKKRPGRPPVVKPPVVPDDNEEEPIEEMEIEAVLAPPTPPVLEAVVTLEECKKSMNDVYAQHGIERARQALVEFKVKKLGDLPESCYHAFKEHCDKIAEV